MKKKIHYRLIGIIILFLSNYNSYAQVEDGGEEGGTVTCIRPTLSYNGAILTVNNLIEIPYNTTSIIISISDANSSTDCRSLLNIDKFVDWISTSNSTTYSFTINLQENLTPNNRETYVNVKGGFGVSYDNNVDVPVEDIGEGANNFIQTILIKQLGNSTFENYYLDSDEDGFGDYNAEPVAFLKSGKKPAGMVKNNLDYCPYDYFETNNGCEEPYENINWVRSASYDIKGNLLSASKAYFDELGKGIQTQTFDIKQTRTWAAQTMYDEQGRPAFQSLSAPITNKGVALNFQFKSDFIKYSGNSRNFIETDFTAGNILDPKKIGNQMNTLGWYYSTNNIDEPNQDITDRPYSRTIYSTLNPGTVKQTIGGNKINGEWKQGYSFSMPAAQEMYYVFGYDYFETNPEIENTYRNVNIVTAQENFPLTYYGVRVLTSNTSCLTGEVSSSDRTNKFDIRASMHLTIGGVYLVRNEYNSNDVSKVQVVSRYSYGDDHSDEDEQAILIGTYNNCSDSIDTNFDNVTNASNAQIAWLKATKTVVQDVQGNESVVFTDTDGKTIAAARVGVPDELGKVEKQYPVLSLIGEQKYVDVHIPEGCAGTASLLGNANEYIVYNLKTELPNGNISQPGFYRIEYIGGKTFTKTSTLTYIEKGTNTIAPVEPDAVGIRYNVNYYDFSLNYYNKTGQLTSSMQPIGFNGDCLDNFTSKDNVNHNTNAISNFNYNALGQLTYTKSPDEGEAWFLYRKDGQIRFSQNSKQKDPNGDGNFSDEEFSYTNYDEFGRPTESGVSYKDGGRFIKFDDLDLYVDTNQIFIGKRKEQHFTEYDFLEDNSNLPTNYKNPTFLSGNVASTYNKDESGAKISQTWYSYDLYGRVKWIVQKLYDFGGTSTPKTVTIDYVYDPLTSQVTSVIYQKDNTSEYFEHRYTYNIAQELEKVETRTTSNGNFIAHADYTYYETGALKRITLAKDNTNTNGIQNIDYIYNLAGQLKAINHPSLTLDNDINPQNNDLFGMTLDYYTGDYKRDPAKFSSFNPSGVSDQFNGNIKALTWNTKIPGQPSSAVQYKYTYNKNNWLTEADFDGMGSQQHNNPADVTLNSLINTTTTIKATNSITLKPGFSITASTIQSFSALIETNNTNGDYGTNDYDVSGITYDANGNILSLNRNKNTDTNGNKMDALSYDYKDNKPNQLDHVIDNEGNVGVGDIDSQSTNNYRYNDIGQLTRNIKEGIDYSYNASGLVTQVSYNGITRVEFLYNDKNYRTKKISYKADGTLDKTTDYILDAAGSTLAIYEDNTLQELPIYGASRLGINKKTSNTSVYQLTDHLGNVRAVIANDGTNNPMALVAIDYYPGGMVMPGRRIVNGEPYRYQYQGQELDPETGKPAFQLRLYDPRINRWLTTDPAGQHASPYMSMGNNWANKIDPDGGQDWYADENGELEWHSGSDVIEGLTWVGSNNASSDYLSMVSTAFGGSGNVPGNGLVFAAFASIGDGWGNGKQQRGKDFLAWMDDPKGRTLQGAVNFIDGAGSFISDYTSNGNGMDIWGFAGKRAFENMADMSLYDWSYAAGYNAPEIALSLAGGYALSAAKISFSLRPKASWFKIHPRLIGQDIAHRSATFFRQEILSNGSFGIKNYKTIYFNHTIGNRNFSIGINPWKRTIFHEGPGVFK